MCRRHCSTIVDVNYYLGDYQFYGFKEHAHARAHTHTHTHTATHFWRSGLVVVGLDNTRDAPRHLNTTFSRATGAEIKSLIDFQSLKTDGKPIRFRDILHISLVLF